MRSSIAGTAAGTARNRRSGAAGLCSHGTMYTR